MKKITFLLAILIIGGMMLTGCKKSESTPEPEPTPTTLKVVYKVDNTYDDLVLSDCFKLNVTYTNANGQSVTENNVTLPWTKAIEVTYPFNAKMEGTYVYNVEELKTVCARGLQASMVGQVLVEESILGWEELELEVVRDATGKMTKEKFLELAEEHPEELQFSIEKEF